VFKIENLDREVISHSALVLGALDRAKLNDYSISHLPDGGIRFVILTRYARGTIACHNGGDVVFRYINQTGNDAWDIGNPRSSEEMAKALSRLMSHIEYDEGATPPSSCTSSETDSF